MKTYPNGAIEGKPGIDGVGERLKCVREMRGLNQAELAEKIETLPQVISKWESGSRLPGAIYLRKLSITLNVSVDYLLDSQ